MGCVLVVIDRPTHEEGLGLAEAERLLHQEFSYVLHMSPEETAAFVCKELGVQRG